MLFTGKACMATTGQKAGILHVRPSRGPISGGFQPSGPDKTPSQMPGYFCVWLARDILRHCSHAQAGHTRAAAQISVMLIEYQMPAAPGSSSGTGERTLAPSGELEHAVSLIRCS